MKLYSRDLRERELAAALYRVFPEIQHTTPPYWEQVLNGRDPNEGLDWPSRILSHVSAAVWPKHAFGTANAACLVIWHRPGKSKKMDHRAGSYLGPHTPILGGIGHVHNVRWSSLHPNPSWYNLHKFLPQALKNSLVNPWSQVMLMCLNPIPGFTGKVDRIANLQTVAPGGRLDSVVSVCRPLVVLA